MNRHQTSRPWQTVMMTMTGEKVATNSDESVMTTTEEKNVAEILGKTGKSGALIEVFTD